MSEDEANSVLLEMARLDMASDAEWKPGLPPGPYYPGMTSDYEVAYAPLAKWHRRRSPEHAAEHKRLSDRVREIRTASLPINEEDIGV